MPDSYNDTPPPSSAPAPLTKSQQATLRRALRLLERQLTQAEVFSNPTAVKQYCQLQIGLERDEHFCCLFLNTRHQLILFERLFRGTVDGASVYPRLVVRRCLELNASAVIFTHNHPSGIAEPSWDDATITRRLKDALVLINVRVLDHILVRLAETTSMVEQCRIGHVQLKWREI